MKYDNSGVGKHMSFSGLILENPIEAFIPYADTNSGLKDLESCSVLTVSENLISIYISQPFEVEINSNFPV